MVRCTSAALLKQSFSDEAVIDNAVVITILGRVLYKIKIAEYVSPCMCKFEAIGQMRTA